MIGHKHLREINYNTKVLECQEKNTKIQFCLTNLKKYVIICYNVFMFFFPISILIFVILLLLALILFFLLQVGIVSVAFTKLGLTPYTGFAFFILSLIGSGINIPIKSEETPRIYRDFLLPVWLQKGNVYTSQKYFLSSSLY